MSDAATNIDVDGRPKALLPTRMLLRISMFWLGLTAIDAAVASAVQSRLLFDELVPAGQVGAAIAALTAAVFIFSFFIQPTAGSISDYTVTRWGRRKPYIVIGATLDAVFLIGIATANTFVALAAFVVLLAVSTNVARGPFQGYIPDLIAGPQVGFASSLVGLMQVVGNIVGFALAALADLEGNVGLALAAVATIEVVTMISVVARVPNGPPAKPREGRSWRSIAAETWGTDILRERSYVWLLLSRLLVLMGGAALVNFMVVYLVNVQGMTQAESGEARLAILAAVAISSMVAIIPAARLSDRIGRKPVIYVSAGLGALSLAIAVVAPNLAVITVAAALFGASQGTFLAVDWALMTEIVPKASAGRYMGISNVATQSASTLAGVIGGLIIFQLSAYADGTGVRVVLVLGICSFIAGAFALRPVVEPKRVVPETGAVAAA